MSAYFKGDNPKAKLKFILSVTYTANPTPVMSTVTVKQNAAYTQVTLPVMTFGAGTVEQIKVTFKHKSTAGKILIDDASLLHTQTGAHRSDVLPPPLAPDGFRGGN